jgi:alkanesulfonate monooxygenase SsuD/methylene tetrahydromethanopterin reductase-like flavin-dependent oxidoreductase (luciferase family)
MVDLPLDDVTRFGLHSRVPSPAYARELVALAEETGLTSIAVGDHLAFALPIDDSILGLGMIATLSEKITIATSVYLLPLRHPALVAKQTITLARMAPGRFIFGVGVGGEFPGEFALAGIPHNERGARLNEGIEIVRKLWTGEPVAHEGRFHSFPETQLRPAPEPAGGPPIWVGGRSKAAIKRAATLCDGWISYVVTPEQYREGLEGIAREYATTGRDLPSYGSAHLLFCRLDDTYEDAFDSANALLSERYAMDFSRATKRYVALGSPQDVAEKLSEFHKAGVRFFEFDFLGTPEERVEQTRRFAKEVRPLLDFEWTQP